MPRSSKLPIDVDLPVAEWLETVRRSPGATFFHTPMWGEVGLAADPAGRSLAIGCELEDGHAAAYPLFVDASGTGHSAFAGCYGGPVATRALEPSEAERLHLAALSEARTLHVLLAPGADPTGAPARFVRAPDLTQHVPLAGRPFEELVSALGKDKRLAYNKARRAGLEATWSDAPSGPAYHEIYQESLERWGDRTSSVYPQAVFDALGRLAAAQPDHVRLWEVRHEGVMVAGAWILTWNGHAVTWHSVTRTEHLRSLSPHVFLYMEILRDSLERGCDVFDFNPSGGHAGTLDFKRRMGGHDRPLTRLSARAARPRGQRLRASLRRLVSIDRP